MAGWFAGAARGRPTRQKIACGAMFACVAHSLSWAAGLPSRRPRSFFTMRGDAWQTQVLERGVVARHPGTQVPSYVSSGTY